MNGEAILMSTHNIGFYEDLTKNIFELSSNIIKYASYHFCWSIQILGVRIAKICLEYMRLTLKYVLISQNISTDLKGPTALWTMYGATFQGRHTAQLAVVWINYLFCLFRHEQIMSFVIFFNSRLHLIMSMLY